MFSLDLSCNNNFICLKRKKPYFASFMLTHKGSLRRVALKFHSQVWISHGNLIYQIKRTSEWVRKQGKTWDTWTLQVYTLVSLVEDGSLLLVASLIFPFLTREYNERVIAVKGDLV